MDGLFFDRINGGTVGQVPEGRTIFGRWLIQAPTGANFYLNSVPVQDGDFLVPDLSGSWRVLDGVGTMQEGKTAKYQCPEEIEAESIRTIGRNLDGLVAADSTWMDWLDVVPLVPGMSEEVDLLGFERQIQERFGSLEAVCNKPRAHLYAEVERVPVAKARRIPAKAASYLASHTEDWERPLIHGVLPKRILSEVRRDQVDIYENRVCARLVDHLVAYLSNRTRLIRKLIKVFQDKEDYSRAIGGTHLRQRRILELWGQSIDANEGRKRAETTLKELENLKYRLMGLMDSPLYRDIPKRTYVAPTLRTTNILANDQNYRRVADLWRAWVEAGHAALKTPADIFREAQALCRGMNHFAFLVVIRAMDQLGYNISEQQLESPIKMPGQWTLYGHGTTAACTYDESGTIRIEVGESCLRFVSVPACLGSAGADEQVQEVMDQVLGAVETLSAATIVLYVGNPDDSRSKLSPSVQRRMHTVGNDPRAALPDTIGFLPISPWDLGSVERVSRALRWFIDSKRFDGYPLVIQVGQEARGLIDTNQTNGWLDSFNGGARLTMRRSPREFEWNLLKIEHLAKTSENKYDNAINEHARLSHELRDAVTRGKIGTLNQQKKSARQQIILAKERMNAIARLYNQLVQAHSKIKDLLVCPACGTEADPVNNFEARANGCFRCDCQECRAMWETRLCANGHRFAVMLPGAFVETDDSVIGWEDRTYGSDLLALPARRDNESYGFVCPTCGDVT